MKKALDEKEKEIWLKNLQTYIEKIDNGEFKSSDIPVFANDYLHNYAPEGDMLLEELKKKLELIRKTIADYFGCKENEIVLGDVNKKSKSEKSKKIIFGNVDMSYANPYVNMFDFSQVQTIVGDANFDYSDKIDLANLEDIWGDTSFYYSGVNNLPSLKNIGGDVNFKLSKINDLRSLGVIGGNANFRESQNINLTSLNIIRGNADFEYSKINYLGNLRFIGGSAWFDSSKIEDLGKLQEIGGDAYFNDSAVINLENLISIGRNADFERTKEVRMPFLQQVKGNLLAKNSKITSLERLKSIGGDADFRESSILNLSALEKIGKNAEFSYSNVKNLEHLKYIGRVAQFDWSEVTDLGQLQEIGGDAYFNDSQVTNLNNLQRIGGSANFRNIKVSNLEKLQEVGYKIYYGDDVVDLETLKKVIKNKSLFDLSKSASDEEIIRDAIKANIPVFLHGKPGSGKSERVRQLDPDFTELNLGHLDPELLDGIAGEKNGKAIHIKPPWLDELEEKCKQEPENIHILFLEELTNASALMQSKAYGIVLDKKVAGKWKLPDNVRVVAAGNELEDSLAANEMAEPLYDRFAHVNIETNAENWLKWAATPDNISEKIKYEKLDEKRPKIHPAIYMFISYKGDEALRTPYDREHPAPHADPRRWKMASDMLYASNNPQTLRAIVGEELTQEFIYFCQTPKITIDDVLTGNYNQEEIEKMDIGEKLAVVIGLIPVSEDEMPKVRKFVKRLGPEICKKFDVQWAQGDEERLEQIQELTMKEQEEQKKIKMHSGDEAKDTAEDGIKAYHQIDDEYKRYLIKEENKESKSR